MAKKQEYYCVIPKFYDWKKMEVLLLAKNTNLAKRIYSKWNDGVKITNEHLEVMNLEIRKIEL